MREENILKMVYLVEDDMIYSEMLAYHFEQNYPSFILKRFATGEEMIHALNLLPHLVILDYHLNGTERDAANGYMILRHLKAACPEVPVVVITGDTNKYTAYDLMKEGAEACIIKDDRTFVALESIIWR
jgi:DNA-binding NarL/FixJ family response regulator